MSELRPDSNSEENAIEPAKAEKLRIENLPEDVRIETAKGLRKKAMQWMVFGLVMWLVTIGLEYLVLIGSDRSALAGLLGVFACLSLWGNAWRLYKKANMHVKTENKLRTYWLALVTAILVVGAFVFYTPDVIRVEWPGVGTCWGSYGNQGYVPMACYSGDAELVAIAIVDNDSQCPAETTDYFDPTPTDPKTWCLVAKA